MANAFTKALGIKDKPRLFIAINLGTKNTSIYVSGRGIIYNQPSIMALETQSLKLIAIGNEASTLIGKIHDNITLVRPLKNAIITDLKIVEDFLKNLFIKNNTVDILKGAIVLIACSNSITQLERNSLEKLCYKLGAKFVQTEEDTKMAALGAGCAIFAPKGTLVVDIGAGKTGVSVISANGVIISKFNKTAGNYIDEELLKYVRSKHTISVGIVTTEQIKKQIGSLYKGKDAKKMTIYGRDIVTGMPKETEITDTEIRKLLISVYSGISQLITEVLEKTPAELAGDVVLNGMIITGAAALLAGTKEYFEDFFQIPVKVAKNASTATIDGMIAYEKEIRDRVAD